MEGQGRKDKPPFCKLFVLAQPGALPGLPTMNMRSSSPRNTSRTLLSATPTLRQATSSFIVSAIPYDEVHTQTITPVQTSFYYPQVDYFNHLYRQADYQGALNLAHKLLYQKEIPLSIRFNVSSLQT
jgi:hypothetical protein